MTLENNCLSILKWIRLNNTIAGTDIERKGTINMWDVIIPIITLLVGLAGGFYIGVIYLKRQISKMQMDEKQLAQMAKSMGMNLNQKQLKQMSQRMKNMKFPK